MTACRLLTKLPQLTSLASKLLFIGVLVFLQLFVFLKFGANSAQARDNCTGKGIYLVSNNLSDPRFYTDPRSPVDINVVIGTNGQPGIITGEAYHLQIHPSGNEAFYPIDSYTDHGNVNNSLTYNWSITTSNQLRRLTPRTYDLSLHNNRVGIGYTGWLGLDGCTLGTFTIESQFSCEFLRVSKTNSSGTRCYADIASCLQAGAGKADVEAKIVYQGSTYQGNVDFELNGGGHIGHTNASSFNSMLGYHTTQYGNINSGNYKLEVFAKPNNARKVKVCMGTFTALDNCTTCQTTPTSIAQSTQSGIGQVSVEPYKICEQIDQSQPHLTTAYNNCIKCVESDINGQPGTEQNPGGLWTAIGCIPRDPTAIVQNLLRVGLGMGGGVALLMILAAGFLFSISQGDPKRTGEAKELITAAITGLLFIIFSVVILQFIGYTVLQIPGFGG